MGTRETGSVEGDTGSVGVGEEGDGVDGDGTGIG